MFSSTTERWAGSRGGHWGEIKMEDLVVRRGFPEVSSPTDTSGASYNNIIIEINKALARHEHVSKLKFERAKYLLWRHAVLAKKLASIDDELASMLHGVPES